MVTSPPPPRFSVLAGVLVRACHPFPALAVTVFGTVLGGVAGNSTATCVLLALALGTGQLSIGWSNDWIDAARDRAVARTDKPLAADPRLVPVVERAIVVALLGTVAFSFALGWRAGLLHLGAVSCAWAYNVGLKSSWLSWLPYALAFAALPGVATFALPAHPAPTWWAMTAGALLGCTAHLTNTLPDLHTDERTGVRGLAHRLGARRTLVLATTALLAGTVVLVLGPAGAPAPLRWAGLGVAVVWTVLGALFAVRRPAARWIFAGTVGIAALNLALLVLGPSFAT